MNALLAAAEPPEARGLARDEVRLMVSRSSTDVIAHARFRDFPDFLAAGDVLVVNASATINASLDAMHPRFGRIELHLSSPAPHDDQRWIVELRRMSAPLLDARAGDVVMLPAGASARLIRPFSTRLWIAELTVRGGVMSFAERYGSPIRYSYVPERWPLEHYQTVFATEPGSAEMPSAGRAFTREIVGRLERKGVRVAPLVLHTGVASLEANEPPYPERYRVPIATADAVNSARRVVAVGTTVVRALETVAMPNGQVRAGEGWTDLVITPERGLYAVDAMVTGFHEPRSSHLAMLESLAGPRHLARAYRAAIECRYLWHEFGDVHLIFGDQ